METQPAAKLRCLDKLVTMLIGIFRGTLEFSAGLVEQLFCLVSMPT